MIQQRFLQISFFLCIIFFGLSKQAHAQSFISPDIREKIITLSSLRSISALFVKPVNPISTSTPYITSFKKGKCPQVSSNQDDIYVLQTINTSTGVSKTYIPKNLVDISSRIKTASSTPICMTESSAENLYKMSQDMKKIGLQLIGVSGYRSYDNQKKLFDTYSPHMNAGAYDRVAPAGHSEHQLGTTIDVASDIKSGPEFSETYESKWIKEHAHEYGFIISYEQGSEDKTGYMYEPWHLRYVGVENATVLKKGEYSLAYKPLYYKESWINRLLGRLKDYVEFEKAKDMSIGG